MSMTDKIPKRIIQVWGTLSNSASATDKSAGLPLFGKASAASLRLLNPGFEYVLFDDAAIDQFIDAEFPQYRPVFDSFSVRIQRYDFFRYLAVYHFGGFYFDTDLFLASGLEDLTEFGCVFPFEQLTIHSFLREQYGMDWEIGNYAFGAAAGHPFLEAVIKNVVRAQRDPEWAGAMLKPIPRMFRSKYFVLDTTGPGLVSRTLAEHSDARDQVKVLFPEDVCDRSSWYRFGDYGVHLQAGSWRKPEPVLYRVTHRYWETTTRNAVVIAGLKRGRKRSLEFKIPTAQHQEASRMGSSLHPGVASKAAASVDQVQR
jgi:inositol phosphorylceramide mannosyltransferase catalytic subunit